MAAEISGSIVPGSGPITRRLLQTVKGEWSRNRSTALRMAEEISGRSREDLAEEVVRRPELVPLVTRLLYEAGMTGHDQMLKTMGAAFGRSIAEPEQFDECEAILIGVALLRPEDVQVLRSLGGRRVLSGQPPEGQPSEVYYTTDIAEEAGLDVRLVAMSLTRLSNAGFLSASHGVFGGGSSYERNDLGVALHELLKRVAER